MTVRITPRKLKGNVTAISSKSHLHRLLIAAALSQSGSTVCYTGDASADMHATMNCLSALGASFDVKLGEIQVTPITKLERAQLLDCGESGTTLRLLVPLATALYDAASFIGGGRLPNRPMEPLIAAMQQNGVTFSGMSLPFSSSGLLQAGVYNISGSISSQFISGLLFALPLLDGDSEIRLTSPLESRGYVDMTLDVLSTYGINVECSGDTYKVAGNQQYYFPGNICAEGDWSNAAFWLCANALGCDIDISNLNIASLQGDKEVVRILERFANGATDIDAADIPDLVPILSVVAAVTPGKSTIYNAGRLRFKECDRLEATTEMLMALGADIAIEGDGLVIIGKPRLSGGSTHGYNDHRLAMAATIASCVCDGEVVIEGAEAVEKSYPAFFRDFSSLGGTHDVI